MKWGFTIKQKIKAASLLILVFVIVLAKNIIDRNNVLELGKSFSSVYEDRLMAENYIYHFAEHLYQKKLAFSNRSLSDNLKEEMSGHNKAIDSLIKAYEKTKLTDSESLYFKEFTNAFVALRKTENNFLTSRDAEPAKVLKSMDYQLSVALLKLNQLSQIQITEGKKMKEDSMRIVSGSKILTQLELGILIIMGLIIQVLIFTSGEIIARQPPKDPSLN